MSGKDLLEGMSYVDEKYVDEAETQSIQMTSGQAWMKWVSLAACLCILVFGIVSFGDPWNSGENSVMHDTANPENSGADNIAENVGPESELDKAWMDNSESHEVCSVVLRIDNWNADGFTGTVVQMMDSEIFDIGTELTVVFSESIGESNIMAGVHQNQDSFPSQAMYPEGTLVEVKFIAFDESSGTIRADIISPAEEQEKG